MNQPRPLTKIADLALLLGLTASALACQGPAGPAGAEGDAGPPGETGAVGPQGEAGPAGQTPDATAPRQFVTTGPGVQLNVTGATVAGQTVIVSFTVTDGAGVPLDYTGVYTDGPVGAKFVISWLASPSDAGAPGEYTAYTQKAHTSVDGSKTAMLPDSDTGGTVTEVGVGQGTYTYTFGTALPAGFDGTKTHTVGIWATRVFGGATYVVNTLYDFLPSGGTVSNRRNIVTTQACNQCHNPLGYHENALLDNGSGGVRRNPALCILCHSQPTVDVSNGNSLDMPVIVHQIHMGRALPSVEAGAPYQLTEDESNVDVGPDAATAAAIAPAFVDHSGAWYPGAVQNCQVCHQGSQGGVWSTAPTRAACGACHDLTSFVSPAPAGMSLHPGGQQTDDSTCLNSGCHGSSDKYGVATVHAVPSTSTTAPQLALAISSVDGTAAGATPVLHFAVTENGQPLDLLAGPLPWLAVTLAGPTTDYASSVTYAIQGTGAVGTLALDGIVGSYAYTFPAPIPASATGSFAVGMEGYVTYAAASGSPDQCGGLPCIFAAQNPVTYVAVTDPTPTPRRTVVERDKCNSCHGDLLAHGGTRKSPEYCVLCHNPNLAGVQGVARFEVPATVAPSENFKVLVHKIHRGSELAQGYVVGATPFPTPANPAGTPVDFSHLLFPGDQRACWACHASTSYLLPLSAGQSPTLTGVTLACTDPTPDASSYCQSRVVSSQSFDAPITSACTACHDQSWDVAHAETQTAPDGTEACVTCHGTGTQWDVQVVHQLPP